METERITLSQRERNRLKLLHDMKQKHLTQVETAIRLKTTERQVRRLLIRVRQRGDGAMLHGLRGRPSNRKLAAALGMRVLARITGNSPGRANVAAAFTYRELPTHKPHI